VNTARISEGIRQVLHYYGGRAGNGVNRTADVIVGGRTITINVATVETGNDCDRQTCLGAHEVFEASNDGNSADCCNGEQPPQCPSCDVSCAAFQKKPSCYPLECGGQTYSMQYLSHAADEFTATGCTKLTTSACNGRPLAHQACDHNVGESACCDGFACKPWSESGGPPFDDTCCRAAGAACTSEHDCCGAMHCDATLGTCACTMVGHYCADSAECCAGTMCDPAQHQCVVPPAAAAPSGVTGGCALASPATESANGLAWAVMLLGATSFMVRARRRRRSRL
jgi:hypothetical protein